MADGWTDLYPGIILVSPRASGLYSSFHKRYPKLSVYSVIRTKTDVPGGEIVLVAGLSTALIVIHVRPRLGAHPVFIVMIK